LILLTPTDLSGEDSMDSEYADVNDGGAMLVDDSEDERDQEIVVLSPYLLLLIRIDTPRPATVLRELDSHRRSCSCGSG
jgi:hypothetical protein